LVAVLPELARTYDPHYLAQLPRADVAPNPGMALAIYLRAASAGSPGVTADLTRIQQMSR
jgi:hypothetical protein